MSQAYLLDIEGTTTPIDFVTRVLFPYARARLSAFLQAHRGAAELADDARALAEEYILDLEAGFAPPDWPARPQPEGLLPYLEWLMDQDRKSTGLKSIQGRIWQAGYESGELRGEIYPDVEPAIRRWKAQGSRVAIFSSGSVLAQRLLFAHLPAGNLTPLLDGYFDTAVGSKRDPDSYRRIAASLGLAPEAITFLSDVGQEIDAAKAVGMVAYRIDRRTPADPETFASFDELPGLHATSPS